jgi:hypothetical protein
MAAGKTGNADGGASVAETLTLHASSAAVLTRLSSRSELVHVCPSVSNWSELVNTSAIGLHRFSCKIKSRYLHSF